MGDGRRGGVGGRSRGRLGGSRGGRCVERGCGSSKEGGLVGWKGIGGHLGEGYYSVCFFEEFIAGGGAGERVLVALSIVSLEEFVEGGGYVGH